MTRLSCKNPQKYVTVTPSGLTAIVRKEYDCELTETEARELADVFNTHAIAFQKKYDTPRNYFLVHNSSSLLYLPVDVCDTKAMWYKIFVLWLETQLPLCGVYPQPNIESLAPDDESERFVTAVLHIGFLTLIETDSMVAKLRGDTSRIAHGGPARSRVFNVLETHTIAPIDAVAAKVSPGDK